MKILILFDLKFKKDILKLKRILNYHDFKQLNKTSYIGNLDSGEIAIFKESIPKINENKGFIILIPICKSCYGKISYFGMGINLEDEKYKIL